MDNWRLKHLTDLHEEDTNDEFVMYALAQEYEKLEEEEKALEFYIKLKTANPDYVGLYYHLAALYATLEELELTQKTYEEGIAIAKKVGDQHALSELMNAKMNWEIG